MSSSAPALDLDVSRTPPESRAPSRPTLPQLLSAIVPGTLVAGALDATFATIAYVFVLGRYSIVETLQYISSGLLGQAAFEGGLATAALGVVLHFGLCAGFTFGFALVLSRWARASVLQVRLAGMAYAAAIWTVMSQVVLPLSGTPQTEEGPLFFVAFLLGHIVLIGLPMAVLTDRKLAALTR